jgi:hypothetical protein
MILTFVKKINDKYYKKIEINLDTDMKRFAFRFDDILKDTSLENLKYWFDISNIYDINKVVKNYGYKFVSFDTDKKIINLKRNKEITDIDIFNISNFFNEKQICKDSNYDDGFIESDCIFRVDDLDINKLETLKEIAKDFDDIKITEYPDDDCNFEFDDSICSPNKADKKYYLNISILNEVLIINRENNKLYVLQCPMGLDYKTIGIENINNTSYLKYNELLDYTKDEISLNCKNLNHSILKPTMENIMIDTFIETFVLNEKSLTEYNERMKTLFDMDIILGIYDL